MSDHKTPALRTRVCGGAVIRARRLPSSRSAAVHKMFMQRSATKHGAPVDLLAEARALLVAAHDEQERGADVQQQLCRHASSTRRRGHSRGYGAQSRGERDTTTRVWRMALTAGHIVWQMTKRLRAQRRAQRRHVWAHKVVACARGGHGAPVNSAALPPLLPPGSCAPQQTDTRLPATLESTTVPARPLMMN